MLRWLMKRIFLVSFFGLALAGCESVSAHVDCVTTAAPSVECEVKQTEGKGAMEVCWDLTVTCKNGTKITPPRTCGSVKDGGTTKVTIPADKLANVDKCDAEPKAVLNNLTVNGKPSPR
jgi:hypothetical protein